MKKNLFILCISILCISLLIGCGNKNSETNANTKDESETKVEVLCPGTDCLYTKSNLHLGKTLTIYNKDLDKFTSNYKDINKPFFIAYKTKKVSNEIIIEYGYLCFKTNTGLACLTTDTDEYSKEDLYKYNTETINKALGCKTNTDSFDAQCHLSDYYITVSSGAFISVTSKDGSYGCDLASRGSGSCLE
jgi:hypothetical protein